MKSGACTGAANASVVQLAEKSAGRVYHWRDQIARYRHKAHHSRGSVCMVFNKMAQAKALEPADTDGDGLLLLKEMDRYRQGAT